MKVFLCESCESTHYWIPPSGEKYGGHEVELSPELVQKFRDVEAEWQALQSTLGELYEEASKKYWEGVVKFEKEGREKP